ncbi:hypothetical protein PROFUN_05032 [Planoprotostelium fungivorum]|uniref:Uncharacterized protein n=1 Tax=Planoprotostelium fungivorum TaxID=1890364 RepID=A0A2P6NS78_9EUKA|nr:hypothetical protein PROFUN_05032 [Planoprotostelium fungivorum]
MSKTDHSSELKELDPSDADARMILKALRDKQTVKPNITPLPPLQGGILSRLQDFLPKIKESNEMLEKQLADLNEKGAGNPFDIEGVEDDKPFIEMNLGLGEVESSSDEEDEEKEEQTDAGKKRKLITEV